MPSGKMIASIVRSHINIFVLLFLSLFLYVFVSNVIHSTFPV